MLYRLLGSLEVVGDDGRTIDLGGAQPRIVVAMLLAAAGRIVAVDSLIEGVWGDDVPSSAAGTLQSYVSRLRRLLEPERERRAQSRVLVWEPPGYRLDVGAEQVDFRRFEELAAEGHDLLQRGDPGAARDRLLEADALWRGDAFAEFADHEFARGLAVRLEQARLAALEDRLCADLRLGRHASAVGELTELVARHPMREGLWANLALALYRSGRQADALRVLDEMRTTLVEELGVDPSPPLRELERQILDHDPALALADRPPVAPPGAAPHESAVGAVEPGAREGATGATPSAAATAGALVGRHAELGQLHSALDEAGAGRARFAVVEGEPGIGKTSLLEAFGEDASSAGARVRWGRCHEGGAAPAFWPWIEVLRALAAELGPDSGMDQGELGRLLGASAPAPSASAPSPAPLATGSDDRFALFEAIGAALAFAAADAPLLVVIDDVQWADLASLELLEFLAARLSDESVLLAVSVRELDVGRNDAVVSALAALTRRPGTRRIRVTGLSERDIAALIERTTGVGADPALVHTIHERSDGNPFFASELARLVAFESDEGSDAVHDAKVPAGVRDVVSRRLAHLPEPSVDVLRAAAVIGRDAELGVLARVAELDLEGCLTALEPALVSRLVAEVPERPATFRFSHALVREVVLDEMVTTRRAVLHRRAADAIVELSGDADDTAEVVAAHLWAAVPLGGRREAAAALERAAEVAVRRFAYESAEELLDRAVQLRRASGHDPADREAELIALSQLSRVRRMLRGFTAAGEITPFDRARELAEETDRLDLVVELMWAEWAAASTAGDPVRGVALADDFLEMARKTRDPDALIAAHHAAGVQSWQLARLREADAHFGFAYAAYVDYQGREGGQAGLFRSGAVQLENRILFRGFHILVRELLGEAPQGPAEMAAFVREQVDPYGMAAALGFDAYVGAMIGDVARAARAARRAIANDPEIAFPFFTSAASMSLGWALTELGQVDEALELIDEHLPRYRALGTRSMLGMYLTWKALALTRAGRGDEADAVLDEADAVAEETLERWQVPIISVARAELAAARGESHARVDQLVAYGVQVAEEIHARAVADRVRADGARLR